MQDAEDSQYRTDSNYAGTAPQLKYVITCPKALELTITDKDNTSIQPSLVEGQENTYSFPIDPNNMPYDYKYTPGKVFDSFILSYYAENGDGGKTAEKNITFKYKRIVPKFNTSDDDNLIISLTKGKSYDGIFANATVEDGLEYVMDMDQGPTHGEVTITDNKYTYTPNESFIKGVTDSFSYYAQDDKGAKTATKKTVNFIYQNTPPTADSGGIASYEDSDLKGAVQGSDVDGDQLSYELVKKPQFGCLNFQADGNFTYVPNSYNYIQEQSKDSFVFKAKDSGAALSEEATINLAIKPLAGWNALTHALWNPWWGVKHYAWAFLSWFE